MFCITDTSRPPRPMEENGQSYWFVSREEMERDAHAGRFLEYGEHNGHLYGTHLDSIRAIIKEGECYTRSYLFVFKNVKFHLLLLPKQFKFSTSLLYPRQCIIMISTI